MNFPEYEDILNDMQTSVDEDADLKKKIQVDWKAISLVWAILRAAGRAIYNYIVQNLRPIYDNIFILSGDEATIRRRLKEKGLAYKDAVKAQFNLDAGSTALPTQEYDLPQGSLFYAGAEPDKILYQTLTAVKIDQNTTLKSNGKYSEVVLAEAIETGPDGNVAQNTIINFEEEIQGFDYVNNPSTASLSGQDKESLQSARTRLQDAQFNEERFTKPWYESKAKNVSGVRDAIYLVVEAGVGKLIIVPNDIGAGQTLLDAVEAVFTADEQNTGAAPHVTAYFITSDLVPIVPYLHIKCALF